MDLRAALQITRPGNCLLAGLGALTGLLLADPRHFPDIWALVGAPVAVALVAAQGNIRNDLADIEIDRVAHPLRPLPSGSMSPPVARALALFLVLVAAPIAWVAAGSLGLVILLVNVGLLELYERRLKSRGFAGNLAIAYLVASTFLFGAVAAGISKSQDQRVLWVAVGMAFLLNLAREILKDVQDAPADRGQRATLPMRIGESRATWVANALVLAAIAYSATIFLARPFQTNHSWNYATEWRYPGLLLIGLADVVASAACLTALNDAGRAQHALKLAMQLATAGFLVFAILWMTFGRSFTVV